MADTVVLLISATSTAVSSLTGMFGLGWWLSGKFRAVENTNRQLLAAHEAKDQERHEENLGRFAEINVTIAEMGGGRPQPHH